MFKNIFRVRFKGLNLDRLINYIMQNYKVYNLKRISYDEMIVDISYNSYYNLLSKIDTSCYNITVEKTFGIKHFLKVLKQNLAMVICLSLSLCSVAFLNTRLLKISIYGANESTKQQIIKILTSKGIKTFKSNNISLNNLEQDLLQNVSTISLVSAVIKGNVLIINVKEKLPEVKLDYTDFVAPYHLIIDEIECYQGTLLKNKGELVKKGETIVGAYILDNEQNQTNIEPIFKLKATTFVTGVVKFKEIETKYVRTGKKFTNSCYNMFGKDFFKINKTNTYKLFEDEINNVNLFNNLFVPLTIKKHTYFELKQIEIKHNFEKEKESYLKQSLKLAEQNLPQGVKVVETTQNIVEQDGEKLIQTYLRVELELTND